MNTPIIYVSAHCPFCHLVQNFVSENNIEVEYKNRDVPEIRDELLERGGKTQVPYLVDVEHNIEMYESADIIEHLKNHHT